MSYDHSVILEESSDVEKEYAEQYNPSLHTFLSGRIEEILDKNSLVVDYTTGFMKVQKVDEKISTVVCKATWTSSEKGTALVDFPAVEPDKNKKPRIASRNSKQRQDSTDTIKQVVSDTFDPKKQEFKNEIIVEGIYEVDNVEIPVKSSSSIKTSEDIIQGIVSDDILRVIENLSSKDSNSIKDNTLIYQINKDESISYKNVKNDATIKDSQRISDSKILEDIALIKSIREDKKDISKENEINKDNRRISKSLHDNASNRMNKYDKKEVKESTKGKDIQRHKTLPESLSNKLKSLSKDNEQIKSKTDAQDTKNIRTSTHANKSTKSYRDTINANTSSMQFRNNKDSIKNNYRIRNNSNTENNKNINSSKKETIATSKDHKNFTKRHVDNIDTTSVTEDNISIRANKKEIVQDKDHTSVTKHPVHNTDPAIVKDNTSLNNSTQNTGVNQRVQTNSVELENKSVQTNVAGIKRNFFVCNPFLNLKKEVKSEKILYGRVKKGKHSQKNPKGNNVVNNSVVSKRHVPKLVLNTYTETMRSR